MEGRSRGDGGETEEDIGDGAPPPDLGDGGEMEERLRCRMEEGPSPLRPNRSPPLPR